MFSHRHHHRLLLCSTIASTTATATTNEVIIPAPTTTTTSTQRDRPPRVPTSTQRLYLLLHRAFNLQLKERRQLANVKTQEQRIEAIKQNKLKNYIEPKNTHHTNFHQNIVHNEEKAHLRSREEFTKYLNENFFFWPRKGSDEYEVKYFSLHWSGEATIKWCVNVANLLGGFHDKTTTDTIVTRLIEQLWMDKVATSYSSNADEQFPGNRNNNKNNNEKNKKQSSFQRMKTSLEKQHYHGLTDGEIQGLVEAEERNVKQRKQHQIQQHQKQRIKYSELVEADQQFMSILDVRDYFHKQHNHFLRLQEKGTAGTAVYSPVFYSSRSAELIVNCFHRWIKYQYYHYNDQNKSNNKHISPGNMKRKQHVIQHAWAARSLLTVIGDCLAFETEYRDNMTQKLQKRATIATSSTEDKSSSSSSSQSTSSTSSNLKSIGRFSTFNTTTNVTSQRILAWSDNYNISYIISRCTSLLPFPTASLFDNQTLTFVNNALLLCSYDIDATKQALMIHQELHKRRVDVKELRQRESSVPLFPSNGSSASNENLVSERNRQLIQENFLLPATSVMSQKFPGIFNVLEVIYRESRRGKSEMQAQQQQHHQQQSSSSNTENTNDLARDNVLVLVEKAIEVIVSNYGTKNNSNKNQNTLPTLLEPFTKKQMTQIILSLGFTQVLSPQLLVALSPDIFTLEPRKGHQAELASVEVQQKNSSNNKNKNHKNKNSSSSSHYQLEQQFQIYLPRFEAVIMSFVLGSASLMPFNPYDENNDQDPINQIRSEIHKIKVDPFFRNKVKALRESIGRKVRSWEQQQQQQKQQQELITKKNINDNNQAENPPSSPQVSTATRPHEIERSSFFALAVKTEEVDVAFQFIQLFFKYFHGQDVEDRMYESRRRGQTSVSHSIEHFSEETFTQVFKLCNECLLPTIKAGANWLDLRDIARIATIGREFSNRRLSSSRTRTSESNNDVEDEDEFITQLNVLDQRLASKIHRGTKKVLFEMKNRLSKTTSSSISSVSSCCCCFPFARSHKHDSKLLLHVAPVLARWVACCSKLENSKNSTATVLSDLVPLLIHQLERIESAENSSLVRLDGDHGTASSSSSSSSSCALNCAVAIAKELLLSQPPCSKLYSTFLNDETVRRLISKQDEENLFAVVATMKKNASRNASERKRQREQEHGEGKSEKKQFSEQSSPSSVVRSQDDEFVSAATMKEVEQELDSYIDII